MAGERISRTDALIALALLVFGQLEIIAFGVSGNEAAAHALWVLAALTALVRRSHPLLVAVCAAVLVAVRFRYGLTPMAGAVAALYGFMAVYGAGAYARGPLRAVAYGATAVVLQVLAKFVMTELGYGPMVGVATVEWLGTIFISSSAAIGGVILRDRSNTLKQARLRAAAVPTEEEAVASALADERAVIARELQALVEVSVRTILDRAAAARASLDVSSADVRRALGAARMQSRAALGEMRRMLSLLRSAEQDTEAAARLAADRRTGLERVLAPIPAAIRHQGMPLMALVVGVTDAILMTGLPADLYGSAGLAARVGGAVAVALAFLPRRRSPLLSAAAIGALILVRTTLLDDYFGINLPLYLAAFAVGAYCRSLTISILGAAFLIACAVASPIIVDFPLVFGAYVFIVVTTSAAWAVGHAGRERVGEAEELHALAQAEEARRRQAVQRAVVDERLHVARDLHDLVGHGLTAISLQCAAGEQFAESDPARARRAIDEVINATRSTLDELAKLLRVLGAWAEPEPPSLSGVPDLVERVRASGLKVALEVSGEPAAVPAGPSATAYRIVQEALTNVSKHGRPGAGASVCVDAQSDRVRIRVASEFDPQLVDSRREGHGLIGMDERVRLYDGTLQAGPSEDSVWVVAATMPVRERERSLVA